MDGDERAIGRRGTIQGFDRDRLEGALAGILSGIPEIVVAYAFGSRVSGKPRPSSDLDVALVLADDDRRPDPLLAERVSALLASELRTPVEVDGRLTHSMPLPLRGRVVTDGVLLYDADPVRRVAFECDTRRLYFDFRPFLERDAREALLAGG